MGTFNPTRSPFQKQLKKAKMIDYFVFVLKK